MNFPKVKTWTGQPVRYIQDKLDGYALVLAAGEALSRKQDVNYWSKIPEWLRILIDKTPPGTVVLGELWWDGPATSIPTLLNDHDERLKFTAFAVSQVGVLSTEYDNYMDVLRLLRRWGFETPKTELFIQSYATPERMIASLKRAAIDQELEGWILKKGHMEGWYKVKPTKTVDAVVTGYTISESMTHGGGVKAIQVSVFTNLPENKKLDFKRTHLREIASVGSGFTAEWRQSIDAETMVGRVCEVEYDSLAANGRLKFPRFLRWREDKADVDCTEDQLCI